MKALAGLKQKKIELTEEERALLMQDSSDEESSGNQPNDGSLRDVKRKRDEK